MRASRGTSSTSTRRSTRARPSRSIRTTASWPGTSSTCPANRSISTKCSSACWSTSATRSCVFTIGKPASCGSSIAKTGKFLGHKETVFQNVFDAIDPKTGEPTYRSDILEQQIGQWVQSCPEHRRRPQLAGDELSPRRPAQLIIPLSQSCMEMSGRKVEFKRRLAAAPARDRRFFEMPGSERQHRQARGLRRQDDEGRCGASSSARRS